MGKLKRIEVKDLPTKCAEDRPGSALICCGKCKKLERVNSKGDVLHRVYMFLAEVRTGNLTKKEVASCILNHPEEIYVMGYLVKEVDDEITQWIIEYEGK